MFALPSFICILDINTQILSVICIGWYDIVISLSDNILSLSSVSVDCIIHSFIIKNTLSYPLVVAYIFPPLNAITAQAAIDIIALKAFLFFFGFCLLFSIFSSIFFSPFSSIIFNEFSNKSLIFGGILPSLILDFIYKSFSSSLIIYLPPFFYQNLI